MKLHILLILAFILIGINTKAQEISLKQKALDEFEKEHYDEAIQFLEKELNNSPNDPEIYYYLGYFNHYKAYDSRPWKGYDNSASNQIFEYFDKAIELNPNFGDAKYFYGAQCSGNAFLAMQNYDSTNLRYFYKKAYLKGAFPNWLLEFGKNFLMSCDSNAILFTSGNMDFDVCSYLQLCEIYRTDITLIPIGNIDRPWYIQFLKRGMPGCYRKVTINITDQQIMDIHPYKWDSTSVMIPINSNDLKKYRLPKDYQFLWSVLPDLNTERIGAKNENDTPIIRTYLSPQRAMLLQIVEDNYSERPIYFSNFAFPSFYGGLEEYFQNCGLVSKLLPIKTKNSEFAFDQSKLEELVRSEHLSRYSEIKTVNIPRISDITMTGYSIAFLNLASIYKKQKNTDAINNLIKKYEEKMIINFNTEYEKIIIEELKK